MPRLTLLVSLLLLSFTFSRGLAALELQGFVTKDCRARAGMIVNVEDGVVSFVDQAGNLDTLAQSAIQTLYTFDVLVNPLAAVKIDERALGYLRAVYVDGPEAPNAYAFPIHFVDDLVIFYGLDGRTRVYTYADLLKLRPATLKQIGTHVPREHRPAVLNMSAQSDRCAAGERPEGVKATRILNDQIAIDAFLAGFDKGYADLASFQERTYLYPRPFVYPKRARLGLTYYDKKEEAKLDMPAYFQWSSGEPYRFQSFTVFGMKAHEFTPNTEPVFALRTDVKSHVFHALFIGNLAGLPAGTSVFLKGGGALNFPNDPFSVQPTFNYMALMGGDVGNYSLSVGLYYPTFGVRAGDEYREILGSSVSYVMRAMFTTAKLRLRVIGAAPRYRSGAASTNDVLTKSGKDGEVMAPKTFDFRSYFLRGGLDYDWNERLSTGADVTLLNGQYNETLTQPNSLKFNKFTLQAYVQRHFGHYVSLNAAVNLVSKDYEGVFAAKPIKKNKQESVLFGSMEFLF